MAISKETWDKARTYFESGKYSLSQIEEKTGINKTSISKKAKIQQWQKGSKADYIEAKELIVEKKSTLKQYEINTLDEIVEERTKHLIYFQDSALKNQHKANKMLDDAEALCEVEAHSRITQRNKETVLGRDKTTEISNTNAQQNNQKIIKVRYE